MTKKTETETDKFLNKKNSKSISNKCHLKWWNQDYHNQEILYRIIETFYFRILIIFLVIVDTSLVITEIMLDSFKTEYECKINVSNSSKYHHKLMIERIEFTMEVVHYFSIGILTFFVIELLIKIYASGKEFWNIRRKKMAYFDAFIVITSLAIDLYLLHGTEKNLGKHLILLLAFRLWRFVRIISSVAEGVKHGQVKHKQHLNNQYLLAVQRLIELLIHKTDYIENNNNKDFNFILEHFRIIDDQCKSALKELNQNNELTLSTVVEQFIEDLLGLENKTNNSIIPAMFAKPSQV